MRRRSPGSRSSEGPDAFTVSYEAVCRGPSLLRYRARIEGRADGSLRFEAEAVPEGDFETNRVRLRRAASGGGGRGGGDDRACRRQPRGDRRFRS